MNDTVDREIVAKKRDGPVEVRCLVQAGATTLTMGGLVGANGTKCIRQRWQILGARQAKQASLAIVAAEQTAAWQGSIEELSGKALDAVGLG